jgi:alcohol dehydrogenase class IV
MSYTYPIRQERFEVLGRNVFGRPDGIHATGQWLQKMGMNKGLGELGIESERIGEMADCAVRTAPWLNKHPNRLDAKTIASIYRESY